MKKNLLLLLIFLIGNFALSAEVTILHTSDTHGRLTPYAYKGIKDVGGFSRRVTFINKFKSENKNVLVLDSGDVFQGTIYYRLDKGKLNSKLLKYVQYDAVTFGNHEFDNGVSVLKQNVKNSKVPFICANVKFKDRYLKKAIKPYIIKEFDNEKYLIIGVTTSQLKNLSNANNIEVTSPIEEIQNIIKKVDFDKLIILSHCGLDEDIEIAKAIPQIDLILGGHNHYFFQVPKRIGKTNIIQDGEFGARVGVIKLNKTLNYYKGENISSEISSDTKTDKIIAKENTKINALTSKIIAYSNITLIGDQNTIEHSQTNLGKLVLLSMVEDFPDFDGVVTNSGSIRINRNLSGQITYADCLEILPFDNTIVLVEIQGKYLKKVLEHGQMTNRRYLQKYLKFNQIDDKKFYKIVTNDYVASGKDGYEYFKYGKIIQKSSKPPVQLLVDKLKSLKCINENNLNF